MVATGNRDIVYEQIFRRLKAEEWYSAYRTSLFLSMSQTNILIFGATGYVAGTLLLRLLKLPHVSITVLVRSADKAEKLRKLNLGPLKTDLLVDSVIRLRRSVGAQNIAAALKKSQKKTRVIHVSGAGVLLDDALGRDIPNKVWDDANIEEMASLEITRIHCNVDLEFLKADEDESRRDLFLSGHSWRNLRPSSGVLVDAGIQDPNGYRYLSSGLNYSAIVELHEFVDFLVLLVTELLSSEWERVPHGKEGYFFIENGSVQLREVSLTAARAMTGKAVSKGRPITVKEFTDLGLPEIIMHILGGNSRCVSTRARRLGWAPVKGKAEFLKEVETYTLENVNKKK
ncbi:hypothetical protein CPB85DRAFT_1440376 [Mucidula mucida]|nr:hypothetical protein CPB85DRAFT_1440376 [Mucidula mucida]